MVSGDVFSDRLLVSTSSPLAQQDLVKQVQNGVNMASGTATTAPSTAPTAHAMPLTAGPSTIELIVRIVVPLGAQGTPSVIQRARPVVSTEQQTMQSTVYGIQYMAPCRLWHPAVRCHACYVSKAFLPNGLLWSGQSVPSYNPNWMSEREQMLQHQLAPSGTAAV